MRGGADAAIERLIGGNPRTLARLISAVENGAPGIGAVLAQIEPRLGRARVVGVTGPPGIGKSTLVSALVSRFRLRQKTVGVIAVDPSSPVSGGAILGDRVRMSSHVSDPGVFIRSVSARGHLGGLSATTAAIVDLMDAAGREVIVVETVGAGQSEVEVAQIADCNVVVMGPGLGDEVQAIKSGILEIADVLVVNKADLPNADSTRDELKAMLALRADGGVNVRVLETAATAGSGIEALAAAIEAHWQCMPASVRCQRGPERLRRLLASAAAQRVRDLVLETQGAHIERVAGDLRAGELSLDEAALGLIRDVLADRARAAGEAV